MRALLAPADSDRVGVVRQILKQRTCCLLLLQNLQNFYKQQLNKAT